MNEDITAYLKKLPFIRLLFPFISGIIAQIIFNFGIEYLIILSILLYIVFMLISVNVTFQLRYRSRYLPGLLICLLLFFSGIILTQVNTHEEFVQTENELFATAILKEAPEEKENSFKSILELEYISLNDSCKYSGEQIIVYFEKSEKINELKYGDEIFLRTNINKVGTQGNPDEFDYRKYLLRKGIVGQTYLRKENWEKTGSNKSSILFGFANKARESLSEIYKSKNITDKEFAVLNALTLGDKSELDKDISQSYAASGAMHILAVSGLHVGILYVLFNFFLRILDKFKYNGIEYGKWLKAIIIILLLWGFALLTGLSPSVRRAALMFSIIIIGRTIKRQTNIYNSLAASAFVLLLIDPYLITSVGFQLSYCAVCAIVFFQPKIAGLFVIKNKLLYYFWSLTAVSIAAQIGTLPLSLYYFNMFPNYFFLTNIIVIPFATLIIYLAVFLLIFSKIPLLGDILSEILKYSVKFLNSSVEFIEQLPFSHTDLIPFSSYDSVFAYLLIISVSIFIVSKKLKILKLCLSIIFVWISVNTILKIKNDSETEFIVYNIKGETAVNIIQEQNLFLSDTTVLEGNKIKYGPMNHWLSIGNTDYELINTSVSRKSDHFIKEDNFLAFKDKTAIILSDKDQLKYMYNDQYATDYIILSGNPKLRIKDILKCYIPEMLIFDSSNNFYTIKDWISECKEAGIKYHSVISDGAYMKRF